MTPIYIPASHGNQAGRHPGGVRRRLGHRGGLLIVFEKCREGGGAVRTKKAEATSVEEEMSMAVEFSVESLRKDLIDVLTRYRVPREDAEPAADIYVRAELTGHGSHGVMRFLRIIEGIRTGTHCPGGRPRLVRTGPGTARIDGRRALGVPTAVFAMRTAIDLAGETGIGAVTVRDTHHFGMAGYYPAMAARHGMLGPTRGEPLVLDMSVAAVSRGQVLEAARRGESLPAGVALDEGGRPTTDPTRALTGSLRPFGGDAAHKAFGLALMIDILSGVLAGAAFGDRVTGTAETSRPCTKGDFFAALDVSRFRDMEEFLDDVEELSGIVKRSGSNVCLPGEIERDRLNAARGRVVLDDDLAASLREAVRAAGGEGGPSSGRRWG